MKKHNINEAWYNTVLDVVGIVDPTGIADLTNAILYFKQGDTFFGILSLISVVPYVGDAVAKPLIGLGKGSKLFKYVDEAFEIAKTNPTKAKELLENAVNSGKNPMFAGLIKKFGDWGGNVKKMVDRIPEGKLTRGFKNNLKMWVDLLGSVGTAKSTALKSVEDAAKAIGPKRFQIINGVPVYKKGYGTAVTNDEKIEILKKLRDEIKDPKLFSSFGKTGNIFTNYKNVWKNYGTRAALLQGVPRVFFGRNPALRAMMRNTKFYLGFLDFIGIANFVGPEELTQQKNKEELQVQMKNYLETPEGQDNLKNELMGSLEEPSTSNQSIVTNRSTQNKENFDPFDEFLDMILKPTTA